MSNSTVIDRKDYDLDGFGAYRFGEDCSPPGIESPRNPYVFSWADEEDEPLPPRPRALPKVALEQNSVEFLEKFPNGLDEGAPSGVFRANITNMGERVLKIFHGVEHDHKGRCFYREAVAYTNLPQGGVCAAGAVPYCYGYGVIHSAQWAIPRKNDWLRRFRDDPKPLKVLILEFLPRASQMTLRWITPQTAQAAMDAIDMIHRASNPI